MSFKESVERISDIIRWNPEPRNTEDKSVFLGPIITGYYVSKKTNVGQNDSNLYELELLDTAKAGSMVSVWGSQLLDGKFADIPQGCMVRITFLGNAQPKTPKGRAYQNFKVEYDTDARRPMREAGAAIAPVANNAAPIQPSYNNPQGF